MATQYTSLLGFALPVTGELDGTWGTTVNDYITQYVDSSIAGTQEISGSQTSVTLSPANGASLTQAGSGATGSSQFQVIKCSGNPASTLTVTISYSSLTNAQFSKTYVVINQTSTNQPVVVRATTSSGTSTGVTISANSRALISWNGSDFVQVGASAGGSNTQVQYNTSGALAGSANLTFDGTTLTAAGIKNSALTSGRVTFATTSGQLTDSSALTFDSGTGTLSSTIYTGRLKAYSEAVTTASVSTSTYNLDTSLTNIFDITLGNNVTFTFTNPPSSGVSRSVTVILRQDGAGNRTATFTNAYYSDGLAPTLSTGANDVDVLTFFTVNGGTFWFGTFAMANVS